ncbi:Rrf2 family transcriptional regulator [Allorhodopirellula heiligendammensis]|uniref:Rrf2 family transcriptional regulator n=1 Tax=Allorhodopirellula heiligendammensis TaxID=2714739 RepID=UPI0011B7AA7C
MPSMSPHSCDTACYMIRNSKSSSVLHILLHTAEQVGPVTPHPLTETIGTNPRAVRRVMAELRQRAYVQFEKRLGGGWTLACGGIAS